MIQTVGLDTLLKVVPIFVEQNKKVYLFQDSSQDLDKLSCSQNRSILTG